MRDRSKSPRRDDRRRREERPRSRSREPERVKEREGWDRKRDRERDRERDRKRDWDRDRRRGTERRSRSPRDRRDRYRRSRSRDRSPSEERSRDADNKKDTGSKEGGGAVPAFLLKKPEFTEKDLEGKSQDEIEMMKMMGFAGFDTTKGKHVAGNDVSGVHVAQKRKYRQYMNRKGGFNRPLDFVG